MTNENFIAKAKLIHGDKYIYDNVRYINSKTKVEIICPNHGIFFQSPTDHFRTGGCKICVKEDQKELQALKFINKANKIHNDKYQYTASQYESTTIPIDIICPEHGKFKQTPQLHLSGRGCPKCGLLKVSQHAEKVKHQHAILFLSRAKSIHGDKYDYSNVNYRSSHELIIILCRQHGKFKQTPSSHLSGNGCPYCANNDKKFDIEQFKELANDIHNNKYNYAKTAYTNANAQVEILCPQHGIFKQRASAHLAGHGCKKCAIASMSDNTNSFVSKAVSKHGDKYNYSYVDYTHSSEKVQIICPTHGTFEQVANNHTNGAGCPLCWQVISGQQTDVQNFIENLQIVVEVNNRHVISPLEIDLWIPTHKLGVEFHGIFHHSANTKDRDMYLKYRNRIKALAARNCGIRLLQIFSNEWENNKLIWKSIIKHKLGLSETIGARKLQLIKLQTSQERQFFTNNHLRGYCASNVCYALTNGDLILMAMSFIKRGNYWEIQRFAASGCAVTGGKSKLFKHFYKTYKPKTVVTYADLRYSDHKCYCNLGFKHIRTTPPNYKYIRNNIILSRHQCQKHKLHNFLPNYNPQLTESENMFVGGYRRLWDAGNDKYVLHDNVKHFQI